MQNFRYITRGGSSPQGKPRVYFTAYPDDYEKYFDEIKEEILGRHNCAIFYLDGDARPDEVEDYALRLGEMQLFVVPITMKLLTTPSRAMDVDIPFALAHHIPVLPLMQEGGLDELFTARFGDLQYLDKTDNDPTAISYDVKLTAFLRGVIVGDELAAKVRAAFDAYIFLSYRKKDRRYAQELMRVIHDHPVCRDIAIWYDEFLTPGEDFNDAIRAALEKSDLFALAVTPGLLEMPDGKPNFVMEHEYPAACESDKPILPAELCPTDREKLSELYADIPEPVSATDDEALSERLMALTRSMALTADDSDPQHLFFIGLAYLSGIDVEVDHERAVTLISRAAEAGCKEAVDKLAAMYKTGEGVGRDLHRAAEWQRRLVDLFRADSDASPDDTPTMLRMYLAQSELGELLLNARENAAAQEAFEDTAELAERFSEAAGDPAFRQVNAVIYQRLGKIAMMNDDYERAEYYYKRAIECIDFMKREVNISFYYYSQTFCYIELSTLVMQRRDAQQARMYLLKAVDCAETVLRMTADEEWMRKEAEFWKEIAEKIPDDFYVQKQLSVAVSAQMDTEGLRALAECYCELGALAGLEADHEGAKDYYRKASEAAGRLSAYNRSADILYLSARCSAQMCGAAAAEGDLRSAASHFYKMTEILDSIPPEARDDSLELQAFLPCMGLGDCFAQAGDVELAKDYLTRSIRCLEAVLRFVQDDVLARGLGSCYSDLANIYAEEGSEAKAEEYYLKALELSAQLAERTGTAERYDDLAVSYYHYGCLKKERAYLEQATAIWRQLEALSPNERYREFIRITEEDIAELFGE